MKLLIHYYITFYSLSICVGDSHPSGIIIHTIGSSCTPEIWCPYHLQTSSPVEYHQGRATQ